MRAMMRLFAHKQFRIFFASQIVSSLGDFALWMAAGIWVKELTGNNGAAGLTVFFLALPSLFSPFYGWVVDAYPRRRVMQATCLLCAMAATCLLAVDDKSDVWIIYVILVAYGLFVGTRTAAQIGLTAEIVPEHELADANSLLRTVREALRIIAPAAGAVMYAFYGGAVVALVNAATFLVAALLLQRLRINTRPKLGRFRLADVADGLRFIRHDASVLAVTLTGAALMLALGLLEPVLFALVENLGKSPAYLGVLISVQGIGAMLGGVVAPRLARARGDMGLVSVGMGTTGIGAVLLIPVNVISVLGGMLLLGVGVTHMLVGATTVMQKESPPEIIGRVYAAFEAGLNAPQCIAILAGAVLIQVLPYGVMLVVIALTAALCVAALVRIRVKGSQRDFVKDSHTVVGLDRNGRRG